MRIALAQIDPTVGDIDGNAAKVAEWIGRAREGGADLVIFPELAIPGYPAEDLYLKRHFVEAGNRAVRELAEGVTGIVALVGFAEPAAGGGDGYRQAHNALAVLADGERARGLPQVAAAELRGLRRAALLRSRRRADDDRGRRDPGRADDLRGRLGRGPPGLGRGRSRGRG